MDEVERRAARQWWGGFGLGFCFATSLLCSAFTYMTVRSINHDLDRIDRNLTATEQTITRQERQLDEAEKQDLRRGVARP